MRRADGALRRAALVRTGACAHHGPQSIRRCARDGAPRRMTTRARSAVAEAENSEGAAAEKICADLADPQTINHDKAGAWTATLWRALSEAGLPLAWVPEEFGGAGADLADGFAVINAAGRFALSVPLAETLLAG